MTGSDSLEYRLGRLAELVASASRANDALSYAAQICIDEIECDAVGLGVLVGGELRAAWAGNAGPQLESAWESALNVSAEGISLGGATLKDILLVHQLHNKELSHNLRTLFEQQEIKSVCVLPIQTSQFVVGFLVCAFTSREFRWRRRQIWLLSRISDHVRFVRDLSAMTAGEGSERDFYRDRLNEFRHKYRRLVEYSRVLIVRTDARLAVLEIHGDTAAMLGIEPGQLTNDARVWQRFISRSDLRRLALKIRRVQDQPREISTELKIINQRTGEPRWILLRAIPLYDADGAFTGWEGFGVDISEKHQTEIELRSQRRRVEALYEVSRSLLVNMDPALVALKGLLALIRATNSDAGIAFLFDDSREKLEIVASNGLSQDYLSRSSERIEDLELVHTAMADRDGSLIYNLQENRGVEGELAKREGLGSAVIVPLILEGAVQGALLVARRKLAKYNQDDYELVLAASNQIGLATRQAGYYASEKRHASSLAALYRLSHELSKQFTPRAIAEHAFPVIQEEIACKRIWLGVINEQRTHLVGQAGMGPGVRHKLINLQVELDLEHPPLDDVLRTKEPVILEHGDLGECAGLTRILRRLNINTLLLVPLVSLGQIVGVVAVEPAVSSKFFARRKLPLLQSMAGEIASVILARRFESKMAETEKMRMAAVLASGVAHNFNNMLQAVMGQASLIEMQSPADSAARESARVIIDSATKGAGLVKQLLSFSLPGSSAHSVLSVNRLIRDSKELYRSVLGAEIQLDVDLESDVPEVRGDYSQLQQVITNLLVNAKQAIEDRSQGLVRVTTSKVRLKSGEIDPELAPGLYVRIDIADNGQGMDAERQARCFEPFYTTKNVDSRTGIGFEGTGLGLSSAYSVIKQHDGVIALRSKVGEGSVLSIYLPALVVKSGEREVETVLGGGEPLVVGIGTQGVVSAHVTETARSLGLGFVPCSTLQGLREAAGKSSRPIICVVLGSDGLGAGRGAVVSETADLLPSAHLIMVSKEAAVSGFTSEVDTNLQVLRSDALGTDLAPALRGALERFHRLRASQEVSESSGEAAPSPSPTVQPGSGS